MILIYEFEGEIWLFGGHPAIFATRKSKSNRVRSQGFPLKISHFNRNNMQFLRQINFLKVV